MPGKKRGGSAKGKGKASPGRKKSPTPKKAGRVKSATSTKSVGKKDGAKKGAPAPTKSPETEPKPVETTAEAGEEGTKEHGKARKPSASEESKSRKRSSVSKPHEGQLAKQRIERTSAEVAGPSDAQVEEESDDEEEELDEAESSQSLLDAEEEDEEDEDEEDEELGQSESSISLAEGETVATTATMKAKKKEHMTDEEKLILMYRRDSELTYPEMIDKDILWYDLLTGENEDSLLASQSTLNVEPETDLQMAVAEEEEGEEDEDEEEEGSEGEEEQEASEVQEVVPEPIVAENPDDDADNFASLMLSNEEEEEGLELLYMETGASEPDTQSISTFPGVVGLNFSAATLEWFEMADLAERKPPFAYISYKRVKLHIYIYQDNSEFFPFRDLLMHYPDFAILVGADLTRETGHSHFMCTSLEGRNMVLHPPKSKKKFVDLRKKEEELWKKLASIVPRKWRTLGSELEVDLETKYTERPLITMHAYRYIEAFNRPYEFADTVFEKNVNAYAAFDSVDPVKMPLLEISEMDVGVQVMPPKIVSSTQTGFSFKRRKICQYENQFLDPESAKIILQKSADGLVKKTRALQRVLLQNEMMNLGRDDYKYGLKAVKGHDVEYGEQSVVLEEYHTYCDLKHSKGRCVTWMSFHPTLEDVVVISLAEGVTFDKRIDLHSKMLMDPNFVLFWDLKDPTHPQLMLDAPADVFSFMTNPSDPQIICGGCANGQVVLWDLGREYLELRARLQDRRRKVKDKGSGGLQFLDKLKDTTEKKYSCPLIAPVGLSNLDQSHKNVVTSVCWLPAHVELGKNGTLYENVAGKSVQFFSAAGDGTVRIWDIRPPKLGLDEYDAIPSDIRSNVYLHLENNLWKHSNKFHLDDGTGSGQLLATILSLSEPRQSDIVSFDALTRREMKSDSNMNVASGSGTSDSKEPSDQTVATPNPPPEEVPVPPKHRETLLPEVTASGTAILDEVDIESVPARKAAGMLNALASVQSSIFIGTTQGQVGLVDWLKNKEGLINPEGGQRVFYNIFLKTIHDGSITSITRSPFYYNLILVVGGGTVSIWKESSSQPILAMAGSEQFPWCGCWSNTRPAVFFVGTREGALQVWDLTEKGHAPVLLQQISPDRITNVAIPKAKLVKKQFLALSDAVGNVFVMLLSGYYYKTNKSENAFMLELMTREEKRLINWMAEADERREKMEAINTAWKESKVTKTDEEIYAEESETEGRLNAEYNEFLEFEAKLSSRLKHDEPELSNESIDVNFKFDELIRAARHREAAAADENEANEGEDEQEDEDEDNLSEDSPLGSEFDFLNYMREQSVQLSKRKSTRESLAHETDSQLLSQL